MSTLLESGHGDEEGEKGMLPKWFSAAWKTVGRQVKNLPTVTVKAVERYSLLINLLFVFMGSDQRRRLFLISNDKNGPFDTTTDLKVKGSLAELLPVTTKDLSKFEYPSKTDRFGNPLEFEDVTDTIEKYAVAGTLYLLSEDKDCKVALYGPKCFFGDEKEFVEAARLGLRLTTSEGTYTYIIPLDDMDDYFAAGTENEPVAPKIFLGNLPADEVTTLDYYLYLEGTDEECKNQAQNRAAELQFYFAGF